MYVERIFFPECLQRFGKHVVLLLVEELCSVIFVSGKIIFLLYLAIFFLCFFLFVVFLPELSFVVL